MAPRVSPRPHRRGREGCGGAIVERVWTIDLRRHVGERARLAGWLHRLRRLSNVAFLILRDGKIIFDGTTLELAQSKDEYIREYIA